VRDGQHKPGRVRTQSSVGVERPGRCEGGGGADPEPKTRWSTRTRAKAVGISADSVRRIWKGNESKPYLTETFTYRQTLISRRSFGTSRARTFVPLAPPHRLDRHVMAEKTQEQLRGGPAKQPGAVQTLEGVSIMKQRNIFRVSAVVILALLLGSFVTITNAENVAPKTNIFAERPLIHVLGPSPAISPNADRSAVDSRMMESGDVFKDTDGTWYWYYHAKSYDRDRWPGGNYRICVATASNPLGPWKRYEGNPVLDVGEEGAWDGRKTACATVMKEGAYDIRSGDATYYMWYWSSGGNIGLATAKNPLGPWERYEGNPVMTWEEEGGAYPGSVTKIGDTFIMFLQSPTSVEDQGPFCIATAPKPEGPWTKYEGNPVMTPGDWGAWDDGGFSEACARYHEGIFHCIYGGTKAPKIESLGYAWSFDAINWHKYQANPVVSLSRVPDASAFAEVHCYVEGPYIYVFHTLRYFTGEGTARGLASGSMSWVTEDLAVQVLTIDPQFKISFPILMMDSLDAGRSSRIAACLPIGLEAASKLAIATECTYDFDAKAGLRVHVKGSDDGVHCDTVDMFSFDIDLQPGTTVRKTVSLSPNSKFAKVIVENLDKSNAVKSLNVTATVGN